MKEPKPDINQPGSPDSANLSSQDIEPTRLESDQRQSFVVKTTRSKQPEIVQPITQNEGEVASYKSKDLNGAPASDNLENCETTPAAAVKSASVVRGTRPGDRYVRVVRTTQADVQRIAPKFVQLSEESLAGHGGIKRLKRFLIGRPITTARSGHERLGKIQALAVFASDALSSVAYATEATLFVLVTALLTEQPITFIIPISIMICLLIALVVNSYRQTVYAYPGGGGSYIVSKDNLGVNAGLVAAGAILIDYTLTVAVSVSAGVAAITSAFPSLNGSQVLMGVGLIFVIMLLNLRGIKESGTIFAAPTYLFIFSFLGLLGFGLFKVMTGDYTPVITSSTDLGAIKESTRAITDFNTHPLTLFLLLQAFAAGCSALTGVEAISDGVQAFKKPESKNAGITLLLMGGLLITFFMGTSFLAYKLNALPDDSTDPHYETVISEIGRNLLGGSSPMYYIIQASTALILILAANTAFADFPRLSFFLARDRFLPNIFAHRGDRLAFSTGIIVLAVLASLLLAIFNGRTESLIPLYAVGVFLAFTLSQSGMVVHWQRQKKKGVKGVLKSQIFNLIGAIATAIVLLIIVVTKFLVGAWLVIILIPMLFLMFKGIHRHYTNVSAQLRLPENIKAARLVQDLAVNGTRKRTILVPISSINKVSLSSLDFARSLSENVSALFISDEQAEIEKISRQWQEYDIKLPLVVLENPFRSILPPLLNYIDAVERQDPDDVLMIVLPEFVAHHWWEQFLHNQTALRIKRALLFRPGIVVVDVPYHLMRPDEAKE